MLEWERNRYGGEKAISPAGEWYLSPLDVTRISYTLPRPDDFDIIKSMERARELDKTEPDSREVQRLRNLNGMSSEFGYAENTVEAKHLVEALLKGSDGLPPVYEALAAQGFTQTYPGHDTLSGLYGKTIKSGTFDVSIDDTDRHRSIHVRYEGHGVSHWHNVARISVQSEWQNGSIGYSFFPEAARDLFAIMMSHVEWVITERMARTKTRLSTPLGGALKRRY